MSRMINRLYGRVYGWFDSKEARTVSRPLPAKFSSRAKLLMLNLEDRIVPNSYTVSLTDSSSNVDSAVTPGSLRYALTQANSNLNSSNAGGVNDTIVFDSSVFSSAQVITLTGQLPITEGVDISFSGSRDNVTVRRNGGSAFGLIGISGSGTTNLSNFTLKGGSTTATNTGGAISMTTQTLNLSNMVIANNTTSGTSAAAAVFATGAGTINLTNSTLVGGTSTAGANINSTSTSSVAGIGTTTGTINVTNSTISNNSATSGSAGVRAVAAGSITITGSTISSNTAGSAGGAVRATSGTVNILSSSVITGNSSNSTGGAVYVSGGPLNITNSTLSNNSGTSGGAAYSSSGTVTVTGSTISGNKATSSIGGGIRVGSATLIIQGGSSIINNSASSHGGGLATSNGTSTYRIYDSLVSGNVSANKGGAIYIGSTPTELTISNSTLANNTAVTGGAISFFSTSGYGTTRILGSTIYANSATASPVASTSGGGGIGSFGITGSLIITNSVFAANLSNNVASDILTNSGPTYAVTYSAFSTTPANIPTGTANLFSQSSSQLALGTLRNYGGTISSVAVFPGSVLVNVGTTTPTPPGVPAAPTLDVRGTGFPRTVGGTNDIGAFERTINTPFQTASTFTATVTPANSAANTPYQIAVTFANESNLDVATINWANAITVTRPNGTTVDGVSFVNYVLTPDAKNVVANYTYTPPANPTAGWDFGDNGVYTIKTVAGVVTSGSNSNVVQTVGTFSVVFPVTIAITTNDDTAATAATTPGTLRYAVTQFNANPSNQYIFDFDESFYTSAAGNQAITLSSALPAFNHGGITILGPTGPGSGAVTIDGSGIAVSHRIFDFSAGASGSTVALQDLTIKGGSFAGTGGGINASTQAVSLTNINLLSNSATTGNGGGIAITSGSLTITGASTLSGNSASGAGGAIYSQGILSITGATIGPATVVLATDRNRAGGVGGAISSSTGAVTISSSTIQNNTTSSTGGAINLVSNPLTLTSSSLLSNTSGSNGGAIKTGSSNITVSKSTLSGNSSGGNGGGAFYFASGGSLNLSFSTVNNNITSGSIGGGAIYSYNMTGPVTISSSTIYKNTASASSGGAIVIRNTSAQPFLINNSTIVGNSALVSGGGIAVTSESTVNTITVSSSIVSGNLATASSTPSDIVDTTTAVNLILTDDALGAAATGFLLTVNGTGGASNGANLLLDAALGLNGAATGTPLTLGYSANSPLVDKGNDNYGTVTDERGGGTGTAFIRNLNSARADIGALELFDLVIPTKSGQSIPTGPIQSDAAFNPFQFTVTYTGTSAHAIDVSTIGAGDVTVTGPGYSSGVTLVGTPVQSGLDYTATYQIATLPDNGTPNMWAVGDNGTYTITLNANQVYNLASGTIARPVATQTLSTFLVDFAAPTISSVTNTTSVTTNAGNNPYFVTVVYNGTAAHPIKASSIDANDITITNGTAATFSKGPNSVSVTAGPGTFQYTAVYKYELANIPNNGSPNVFGANDNGTYSINLVGNQVQNDLGNNGGAPAQVLGSFAVSVPAPTAVVASAPDITANAPYEFSVTFSDTEANFSLASITATANKTALIYVSGPGGDLVATYKANSATPNADATSITATYSLAAATNGFAGAWDYTDNGLYTVKVYGGKGANSNGDFLPANANIGTFNVSVAKPSISGVVYHDDDYSGVQNGSEAGEPNVLVYEDTNNNGIYDVYTGSFSGPGVVIADVATENVNTTVSGLTGSITDVNVHISLQHTYNHDLKLSLISPDNTTVVLFNQSAFGANFVNVLFDDSASKSITTASGSFTGSFKPSPDALALFNSKSPNGTWTLKIQDLASGDSGTLQNWSIDIATGSGVNETSVLTDSTGAYSFPNETIGTHVIRQIPLSGEVQVAPSGNAAQTVTIVDPNASYANANFGNNVSLIPSATASGSAVTDNSSTFNPYQFTVTYQGQPLAKIDPTTIRSTDSKANAITVTSVTPTATYSGTAKYISDDDVTNDPQQTITVTYQIDTLPANFSAGNWDYGDNGSYAINVVANKIKTTGTLGGFVPAGSYGNFSVSVAKPSISGVVYQDDNYNGVQNGSEAGEANVLVYDDVNNNGVYDLNYATANQKITVSPNLYVGTSADIPLTVTGATGAVTDVNIKFNITTTYDGDDVVSLIAPDGTIVQLFSGVGGATANFTNTILDDSAATFLSSGTAPYTATFKPTNALSAFNGKTANGVWKLRVADAFTGDPTTLNNWTLDLTYAVPEPSILTDGSGAYSLANETVGTHVIRQIPPTGQVQVAPSSNAAQTVTITDPNASYAGKNFGNNVSLIPTATASGSAVTDNSSTFNPYQFTVTYQGQPLAKIDPTTIRSTDSKANAITVTSVTPTATYSGTAKYISDDDVTNDPQQTITVTYQIDTLPANFSAGNWDYGDNGSYAINVVANKIKTTGTLGGFVPAGSYGNFSVSVAKPSITGVVYHDDDSNGVQNGSEAGEVNVVVYDDLNNNGKLDNYGGNFSTGTVNSVVPDAGGALNPLNSTLSVSGLSQTLTDVNITFNIAMTFDGDLVAKLIGPTGKSVDLFTNFGGANDNFFNTTLDDAAATSLTSATYNNATPYTGTFKAAGLLSDFNGLTGNGTWTLRIYDTAGGDTATLQNWTLQLAAGTGTNEPSVLTDGSGSYTLANETVGTHVIREIAPVTETQFTPASNAANTVTIVNPNAAYTGYNFGNVGAPTAAVTAPNVTNANNATPYVITVVYTGSTASDLISASSITTNSTSAITVTGPNGPVTATLSNASAITAAGNAQSITATYNVVPGGAAGFSNYYGESGTYTVAVVANKVAQVNGIFVQGSSQTFTVAITPYIVTNTNDAGPGSLRAAVLAANANPGADTISFGDGTNGTTDFSTPQTITLTTGVLSIMQDLTITGRGAALTTINGSNAGIFNVNDNANTVLAVTISGLELTGASASKGGAITVGNENLTLNGIWAHDNHATDGGVISIVSPGAITILNSTLSGNSAGGRGGAVYFASSSTVTVTNSTLSGNTAVNYGGAIAGYITNSGLRITVNNSTITGNTSGTGGAIRVTSSTSTVSVISSIISGNGTTATTGTGPDIVNAGVTADHSALGTITGYTLTSNTNAVAVGANLKLNALNTTSGGGLFQNGGTTPTISFGVDSPLVDAGSNPLTLAYDQRGTGFPRELGTADVGAYEGFATPTVSSFSAPTVVIDTGNNPYHFTVTYKASVTFPIDQTTLGNDLTVSKGSYSSGVSVFGTPTVSAEFTTVTYELLTLPDNGSSGFWAVDDNGTYTITLGANQVADVNGRSVVAGIVGTFDVAFAAPTITAFSYTSPVTSDSGNNPYHISITYTGTAANPVLVSSIGAGDLTVTGPNSYTSGVTLFGTPVTSGNDVTADYVIATLPNNNSPNIWSANDNGLYTISLNKNQVTNNLGNAGAAQPVASIGSGITVTITAPTASASSATPVTTNAGNNPYKITVIYTSGGSSPITLSSVTGNAATAITVTGPSGPVTATFSASDPASSIADSTTFTAVYLLTIPGGNWDYTDNGGYTVKVVGGKITQADGDYLGGSSTSTSTTLSTFSVAVPLPVITGIVYQDSNYNGVQDGAEAGEPNVFVYDDLNNNGVYDPGVTTFTNPTNIAIPDNGETANNGAISTIAVSGLGTTLSHLTVTLNITHPFDADLDVFLVGPNNVQIPLFTDVGLTGDDFTGTILDDGGTVNIDTLVNASSAPFTGTYQPEQPLSTFNGINPNGNWTLKVFDDAGQDIGTLLNWSIAITDGTTEPSALTDGSGNYTLSGIPNGTHLIRELASTIPSPEVQLTPAGNAPVTVVVNANANPTATYTANFGNNVANAAPTFSAYAPNTIYDTVGQAFVNDTQRSRIVNVLVTFTNPLTASQLTSLQNGTIPIQLFAYSSGATPFSTLALSNGATTPGDGLITVSQDLVTTSSTYTGANAVFLTFSVVGDTTPATGTGTFVDSGSLADGYYQLTIGTGGSIFTSAGDEDTNPPVSGPTLRRLFGDFDNSGSVDPSDVIPFGGAFGVSYDPADPTNLSVYAFQNLVAFDFDNSGSIDPSDVIPFGGRFGVSL